MVLTVCFYSVNFQSPLDQLQSDFWPQHSTETAIAKMIKNFLVTNCSGHPSVFTLIDLLQHLTQLNASATSKSLTLLLTPHCSGFPFTFLKTPCEFLCKFFFFLNVNDLPCSFCPNLSSRLTLLILIIYMPVTHKSIYPSQIFRAQTIITACLLLFSPQLIHINMSKTELWLLLHRWLLLFPKFPFLVTQAQILEVIID